MMNCIFHSEIVALETPECTVIPVVWPECSKKTPLNGNDQDHTICYEIRPPDVGAINISKATSQA